jgi:hypothetical protein
MCIHILLKIDLHDVNIKMKYKGEYKISFIKVKVVGNLITSRLIVRDADQMLNWATHQYDALRLEYYIKKGKISTNYYFKTDYNPFLVIPIIKLIKNLDMRCIIPTQIYVESARAVVNQRIKVLKKSYN